MPDDQKPRSSRKCVWLERALCCGPSTASSGVLTGKGHHRQRNQAYREIADTGNDVECISENSLVSCITNEYK